MSKNEEAFQTLNAIESTITPYVYFEDEQDRRASVEAFVGRFHTLFTGVPGGGKTTLAKALAASADLTMGRFQGDPMATTRHIIGSNRLNSDGEMEFIEGPIFSDILVLDEFNRNLGQTQAAVIQGMEEGQVTTTDGVKRDLSRYFVVLATQNKKDKTDGINALTEANTDRFAIGMDLSKPYDEASETKVYAASRLWKSTGGPSAAVGPEDLDRAYKSLTAIEDAADADRIRHAQWLVKTLRESPLVDAHESLLDMGRPGIVLMGMAATGAAMNRRDTLEEVDINRAALYVLPHRIEPSPTAIRNGYTSRDIVTELMSENGLPIVA